MSQKTKLVSITGDELKVEKPFVESVFENGQREMLIIYEIEKTHNLKIEARTEKLIDISAQQSLFAAIMETQRIEVTIQAVMQRVFERLTAMKRQAEGAGLIVNTGENKKVN